MHAFEERLKDASSRRRVSTGWILFLFYLFWMIAEDTQESALELTGILLTHQED
jgi:hypothetical protein